MAKAGFSRERFTSPGDYLVYPTIQEVPEKYFGDSFYIVERFLPEKVGDTYFTNLYVFMGESSHCFRLGSRNRIVYSGSNTSLEIIEPHPQIVEMRRTMQFDYGKFDYCIHDGKPVLLDTNKLIGMSNWLYTKSINEMVRARGEGLYGFF